MCGRETSTLELQPQVANATHASSTTHIPTGCTRSVGTRALLGKCITRRPYEGIGACDRLGTSLHRPCIELDACHREESHDVRAQEASPHDSQNTAIADQDAQYRIDVRWWNSRRSHTCGSKEVEIHVWGRDNKIHVRRLDKELHEGWNRELHERGRRRKARRNPDGCVRGPLPEVPL